MPETTMMEQLRQIDTSAIEELCEIKHQQEVLDERLTKMEEKREAISEAVYERVRSDYQDRRQQLEDQARPLKTRARQEYAKLGARREEIEGNLEAARLDKEELEFRHELGEFEDEEFNQRLAACSTRLEERQAELAEAEQLKQRFLAAFHCEEELTAEPAAAGEAPPAGPQPAAITEPTPVPEPAVPNDAIAEDETISGVASGFGTGDLRSDRQRTRIVPADLSPAGADSGKTAVMRGPRLIATNEEGASEEFLLGLEPVVIGRGANSTIRLVGPAISRRHSELTFGVNGYTIRDLGSENGTRVNGELVTERELADGDLILIGVPEPASAGCGGGGQGDDADRGVAS